ncbi:MAG: membrane protein insertion efficiency factor YidD [Actinobacteria bacterium]|nr:membrane protein insertion efficiency factor YidD [Actinomycetota bacterium]
MRKFVLSILKFYKKFISPILPNSCRFYPTCSQYAAESVEKYGVLKGSIKSIYRIIRCNPFNKGGYDPVK